jgi:hypothetical protein
MPADLIDASVANGAKGIVIAGVSNGNMNKAWLEAAGESCQERGGGGQKQLRCQRNRRAQRGSKRR